MSNSIFHPKSHSSLHRSQIIHGRKWVLTFSNSTTLRICSLSIISQDIRKSFTLSSTTSKSIIQAMKTIFARHGIPEVVMSDNGPQYSSQEFKDFAADYNFKHITSSPNFPQSNGQAERGVKTVKRLLTNARDPFLSLLLYRTTPLPWCNISPAELLIGRAIRSNIPQPSKTHIPTWPYIDKFRQDNQQFKLRQKTDFDSRHRVRPLPEIPVDTEVGVWGNVADLVM